MRLGGLLVASLACTSAVVYSAFSAKPQFYTAVVSIEQNALSMTVHAQNGRPAIRTQSPPHHTHGPPAALPRTAPHPLSHPMHQRPRMRPSPLPPPLLRPSPDWDSAGHLRATRRLRGDLGAVRQRPPLRLAQAHRARGAPPASPAASRAAALNTLAAPVRESVVCRDRDAAGDPPSPSPSPSPPPTPPRP